MALHATAILSTSRACMDIPAEVIASFPDTTPTTKPSPPTSATGSKPQLSSPNYSKSEVMCLTPCPGNKYFRLFVVELLKMFDRDNKTLLERKGSFIVR